MILDEDVNENEINNYNNNNTIIIAYMTLQVDLIQQRRRKYSNFIIG